MICLDAFQSKKHLTAIFWTFELSSTSSLSSIWLKYGMKSYFMVKSRNGYKSSSYFCLPKNGKVPLVCLYLPANMADRRWSFELNSDPIVKISQNIVISLKRSSLPLSSYLKKHGKCLVLTKCDPNVLRSP